MYLRLLPGRVREPLRDRGGQLDAGKQRRAPAMIERRQQQIVGEKRGDKDREHDGPEHADPEKPQPVERGRREKNDPQAEEQPQRKAPHRTGGAAGDERKREQRRRRAERQQRDDAAVEGVGIRPRRRLRRRPQQRRRDQQRGNEKVGLADDIERRVQQVIERSARRCRPRLGIAEGNEIVLHQPDQMRCHDDQRHRGGDPGAGSGQAAARIAVEQVETAPAAPPGSP